MDILSGKKILLGVTGGIAAYKSTFLTRLLVKAGAEVKIILTPAALDFVTPLTLSTLSKNPVLSSFTEETGEVWNNHVDLALWADAFVIAPATSNTLAKMATGQSDNILLATYMSAKCPVFAAPAMDLDMYKNPATRHNLDTLAGSGVEIIPAESGELASGLSGEGRMAEPENIIAYLEKYFAAMLPLRGKRVLINGGPTYEPIDAVRFVGNFSSGKMGIALAREATRLGAETTLVLGPTHLPVQNNGFELVRVTTALEMKQACDTVFPKADFAILSAAISDFRPAEVSLQKIKKTEGPPVITLVENPDILKGLGEVKKSGQILVGFALEKENEEAYAKDKLKRKNLDFVILNSLNTQGAGFGHDTNQVTVIHASGKTETLHLASKDEIANQIWDIIRA